MRVGRKSGHTEKRPVGRLRPGAGRSKSRSILPQERAGDLENETLVLIGGVVSRYWIGIGVIRAVLCLLDCRGLVGLLGAGEAIAAPTQQQGAGNQQGAEKGRDGGTCRTAHENTGLITGSLAWHSL